MGRARIAQRIDDLEATCGPRISGALVRQIAADEGITEAELLAETEALRAICRAKGIMGEAAMVRYWVGELDITQAELDAWTERYQAWL